MVETAFIIKREDPTAKCIFIGPCTSKKLEYRMPKTKGGIDCVLSFEELQAFFDARDIRSRIARSTRRPITAASSPSRAA